MQLAFLTVVLATLLTPFATAHNDGPHVCPRALHRPARPCAFGLSACPVYEYVGDALTTKWSWLGRHLCVDIMNDLESCGGCIVGRAASGRHTNMIVGSARDLRVQEAPVLSLEEIGMDCTQIENAVDVQCVEGRCVIRECEEGWTAKKGRCIANHELVKVADKEIELVDTDTDLEVDTYEDEDDEEQYVDK